MTSWVQTFDRWTSHIFIRICSDRFHSFWRASLVFHALHAIPHFCGEFCVCVCVCICHGGGGGGGGEESLNIPRALSCGEFFLVREHGLSYTHAWNHYVRLGFVQNILWSSLHCGDHLGFEQPGLHAKCSPLNLKAWLILKQARHCSCVCQAAGSVLQPAAEAGGPGGTDQAEAAVPGQQQDWPHWEHRPPHPAAAAGAGG